MTNEISKKRIYEGYSAGTFYSLGPFGEFLRSIGSGSITSSGEYGSSEGGKEVWLTPEGIGVLYSFWRAPEKFNLPRTSIGGTKWTGMLKITAFGLEAKLEAFEAQVKQEAEKFHYTHHLVE